MPFSGLAHSKLKLFSTKIKGRLCVYRGIVWYHFQYGLWEGGLQEPPPPQTDGKTDGQTDGVFKRERKEYIKRVNFPAEIELLKLRQVPEYSLRHWKLLRELKNFYSIIHSLPWVDKRNVYGPSGSQYKHKSLEQLYVRELLVRFIKFIIYM